MSGVGVIEEVIDPNEAALTAEFVAFLKDASLARASGGPVRRFNQGRPTACVEATFTVLPDLAPALRVGLFARAHTYQALIRFANATTATDREKDTRGMSISILDVPGSNLTPGQTCHDFVLNSHPVMVAPNAKEFLELLRANEAGGFKRIAYFATHPKAARIGRAAQQHHTCHLDIPYWSTTPYAYGPGRAVKYMAKPVSDRTSTMPEPLTDDYLRTAIRTHLAEADATFDFSVQFYVDERTPIEDASEEWTRDVTPWVTVARITIPRQPVDNAALEQACDARAFSPWHALAEHKPLGGMNRARREIYRALSAFRRGTP